MQMLKPETDYVYVITRLDIPAPHISVQIAHAAMAATYSFTKKLRSHPHLCVCAVSNEEELDKEFNRLKEVGVPCCAWYEDDMGNQLTAVAAAPLRGNKRKPLRRYKLLPARIE